MRIPLWLRTIRGGWSFLASILTGNSKSDIREFFFGNREIKSHNREAAMAIRDGISGRSSVLAADRSISL